MSLAAFLTSAAHDNVHAVRASLESGAFSVDARDSQLRTALHHAAAHGAEAVVSALVSTHGASLGLRDTRGRTPFLAAVMGAPAPSTRRVASFLLPLTLAAQASQGARLETVGAVLCALLSTLSGEPALDGNLTHGVQLLLGAGASVEARDSFGRTPLMLLCCREGGGEGAECGMAAHLQALSNELLSKGADPCAVDDGGATPLRHALLAGNRRLVTALLASGFPISEGDVDPLPPLSGSAAVVREAGTRAVEGLVFSPRTTVALAGGGGTGRHARLPPGLGGVGGGVWAHPSLTDTWVDGGGSPIPSRLSAAPRASFTSSVLGGGGGEGEGRYRWGGFAYCAPCTASEGEGGAGSGGCGSGACDTQLSFDYSGSSSSAQTASSSSSSTRTTRRGEATGAEEEEEARYQRWHAARYGEGSGGCEGREVAWRQEGPARLACVSLGVGCDQRPEAAAEQLFRDVRQQYLSTQPSHPPMDEGARVTGGGDDSTCLGRPSAAAPAAALNAGLSEDAALAVALQLSLARGKRDGERGASSTAGVRQPGELSPILQHPGEASRQAVNRERVWRRRRGLVAAYNDTRAGQQGTTSEK